MKRIFILCISILIICFAFAQNGSAAGYSASVQNAQRYLKQLGYNPGPADGLMGKRTTQAIQNFQHDKGLPTTGTLDRKTEETLFSSPSPGKKTETSLQDKNSKGERTLKAQQYLQQLGYNPGPADGKYGKRTESAVKNFQQDHGLPVTGMIGDQIIKEMKALLDSRTTPRHEMADAGEHKQESPGRSAR